MWLPHTVAVAPGRVEITGNFREWRLDDLESQIGGKRTATVDAVQGRTGRVTFSR